MKTAYRALFLAAALTATLPPESRADAVTTTTVTQQAEPGSGQRIINLSEFDLNKNGLLSTFEVGEMLFSFFDADSSGVIDEAEYERRGVLTVAPMEKETTIAYDYNNDGVSDHVQYKYETFLQDTSLAKFDQNKDGLSPHEFISIAFAQADSDASRSIDMTEWRNAYISKLAPMP